MNCKTSAFVTLLAFLALASTTVNARAAACNREFADLFEAASPSVVTITAIAIDPFRLDERVEGRIGSGFVIEGDLIVTNSHVVYGAKVLIVQSSDMQKIPAELVGADPILDLAVLRLRPMAPRDLPALRLGDSDTLRVGEDVMAVGNPVGIGQTATVGVVSALNRVLPLSTMSYLMPFIQIDAAINPGNSGGPLINRCGEVVGVTTSMLKEAQAIGFAVPTNLVKQVVPELIARGHVVRPWYGVYGRMIDPFLAAMLHLPPVQGYLVETIEPGSPGEKIGLKGGELPVRIAAETFLLGGDIITKVDDTELTDIKIVRGLVNSFKVGQSVRIEYFRPGEGLLTAEVELPERPTLPSDIEVRRRNIDER